MEFGRQTTDFGPVRGCAVVARLVGFQSPNLQAEGLSRGGREIHRRGPLW